MPKRQRALLVTHIFWVHFKVPIVNELWHTLRMQDLFSVSIMDEFTHAHLGDQRLNRRLPRLADALARQPDASIPSATGSWGQACAAYRFLAHTTFTPDDLLQPHWERTRTRAAAHRTVLAVADTTSLHFGNAACTPGLGPVGNRATQASGLLPHSLLAFTPAGLPLGVLDSQWWARDPAQFGGNHQRNRKPVSEKESAKWLRSYAALQTHAMHTPNTRWVLVADRESDLYELFAQALAAPKGPGVLVRAQHDRSVEKSARRLFAHLARTPVAGQLHVQVPRRPGQAARTARVSVRHREVRLSAPWLKAEEPALTLWAVEVREAHPPRGCAPLHWRLLTTEPVTTLAEATRIIGWYGVRWGIEVFHKVLKSGCAVEAVQLEKAERLQRYLAVKLVIAWQVMALTHLGRVQPTAPVREILAAGAWRILRMATGGEAGAPGPPKVGEVVQRLARLGGHLGRRSDGPPGPLSLARGLQRLQDITLGWQLARKIGKAKTCA